MDYTLRASILDDPERRKWIIGLLLESKDSVPHEYIVEGAKLSGCRRSVVWGCHADAPIAKPTGRDPMEAVLAVLVQKLLFDPPPQPILDALKAAVVEGADAVTWMPWSDFNLDEGDGEWTVQYVEIP